ncbi:hypothetical protein K2173_008994 [Erythroxylum novogranatense]|uniref:Hexosyltransferase n=1 Tax=Erythroxylum novogranatense TaxID=1862640 RepID=A0AAV8TSD4_9ROSI|nr:hypothetical protein K2173_008994 [Erythroxylum novogranatense]
MVLATAGLLERRKVKMTMRKMVMAMLFVSVIAPIVFYIDRFAAFQVPSSRNDFLEDISAFTLPGDTRHLNVLPLESSIALKEPIGIVYTDDSTTSSLTDITSDVDLKDLQLTEERDHKSVRILYTTDEKDQSQAHNAIRQVTAAVDQKESKTDGAKDAKQEDKNKLRSSSQNEVEQLPTPTLNKINGEDNAQSKTDKRTNQMASSGTLVRKLKDQLISAKVYLSLPVVKSNPQFTRELRLRLKEVQHVLGDSTNDSDLPKNAFEKLKAMDQTLAKVKQLEADCSVMVKKLRAMLHSAEEQLQAHKKQTLFLTQLTAKTLPKGLHCLPLRLSTEYYALNSSEKEFANQEKLEDPQLYHYALFSDNVLAAAVVVNSTATHAKDASKHVFHIVTDRLNYAAMRMWFLRNPPGKATIDVQNIEELKWLNASYSPVLKQLSSPSMIDYYFRAHHGNSDPNLKYRNPKYLSILNHLRFYLPEIFPKLDKVLFLDDDIVVQKDLTDLWSLDLKGNVNGAVETCGESFHRFDRYLNFSNPLISKNFDPRACGWAYGMNIFDLTEWKRQNITDVYHRWQNLNHDRTLWKLGTLPPGLITFWNRTYPLDRYWHVLGLGYNPNVNQRDIEQAAVIHYNGNLKPWLEIGIPKYRNYWAKHVDYDHVYLRECNINP